VLDSSIQSGKQIPKWIPRARVGIYIGKSLRHARSVSLVLNPCKGMGSPQNHCKYDDTSETVRDVREETRGTWREKCGFLKSQRTLSIALQPKVTPVPDVVLQLPDDNVEVHKSVDECQEPTQDSGLLPQDDTDVLENEGVLPESVLQDKTVSRVEGQGTRQSTRIRKPTKRYLEELEQETINLSASAPILEYDEDYLTFIYDVHPVSVLAQTDDDTMNWDQDFKQNESQQFVEAAIDRIRTY
jgi:hypothetical protein